jgi:hypothetical protein
MELIFAQGGRDWLTHCLPVADELNLIEGGGRPARCGEFLEVGANGTARPAPWGTVADYGHSIVWCRAQELLIHLWGCQQDVAGVCVDLAITQQIDRCLCFRKSWIHFNALGVNNPASLLVAFNLETVRTHLT